jgi:hypothetical protein
MFHESPSVHQTLPYKPHANIEIPVGMKKFFPYQIIDQWQYFGRRSSNPSWMGRCSSAIYEILKSHFGDTSPAY